MKLGQKAVWSLGLDKSIFHTQTADQHSYMYETSFFSGATNRRTRRLYTDCMVGEIQLIGRKQLSEAEAHI